MEEHNLQIDVKTITVKYVVTVILSVIILSLGVSFLMKIVIGTGDDLSGESAKQILKLIKTKSMMVLIINAIIFFFTCKFTTDALVKKYYIKDFKEEFFKNIVIFLLIYSALFVAIQISDQNRIINKAEGIIDIYEKYGMEDYVIEDDKTGVDLMNDLIDYCKSYKLTYAITTFGCAGVVILFTKRWLSKA